MSDEFSDAFDTLADRFGSGPMFQFSSSLDGNLDTPIVDQVCSNRLQINMYITNLFSGINSNNFHNIEPYWFGYIYIAFCVTLLRSQNSIVKLLNKHYFIYVEILWRHIMNQGCSINISFVKTNMFKAMPKNASLWSGLCPFIALHYYVWFQ